MRHEEMRRENLGNYRARDGQGRQARTTASALVLQPGIREGRQHDVLLPSGQGATFEVIESQFVLELLVLLLDRPALVRELNERFHGGGRRQIDQVVLGARGRPQIALAEQPDFGRYTSIAPLVPGGDAEREEAGTPGPVGSIAPRN